MGVRDSMDSMFFQTRALATMIDEYTADGIVFHPIKSCRTVSTGLADNRRPSCNSGTSRVSSWSRT